MLPSITKAQVNAAIKKYMAALNKQVQSASGVPSKTHAPPVGLPPLPGHVPARLVRAAVAAPAEREGSATAANPAAAAAGNPAAAGDGGDGGGGGGGPLEISACASLEDVDELSVLEAYGCPEVAHGVYSKVLQAQQKAKQHQQEQQGRQQSEGVVPPQPPLQHGRHQQEEQLQEQVQQQPQEQEGRGQAAQPHQQFQQQAEELVHQAAALTHLAQGLIQGSWQRHVQHRAERAATGAGVKGRAAAYQAEVGLGGVSRTGIL